MSQSSRPNEPAGTAEPVARRLAAIVAADVAGYSRLMGLDEAGTARALREHRAAVDPIVARFGGRVVKTTGDGVLLEFPSVVAAVECAVAVQKVMAERNADVPEERRMLFRFGINLGDVLIQGDDILGDGVNVAARLEGIAEPGGICVSDNVYQQVRGKIDASFDNIGDQQLKNISRPVRVYRIQLGAADPVKAPASSLPLPDKPSIAVLPFQNMSGDPEQEYFADGIAEDIITALSRFQQLFVIARNSSFTYKGRPVDVKQVGRELGVRYVLEGSVRKGGSQVRITGQLIDATNGAHLWADRFDGMLENIFDLQDRVTAQVVSAIAPKVEQAEIERARLKPTESLDGYDYYLKGMALISQRSSLLEAINLFKRAFQCDPEYGAAYAMAAWGFVVKQGITGITLVAEERAEAIKLAQLASRFAKDDAFSLSRSAHVLTYLGGEYERGRALVEQAVSLNPNLAVAWYARGWIELMCGEPARALDSFATILRLSPVDPLTISMWSGISWSHFLLRQHVEGSAWAMKAIQMAPDAHSLGAFAANAIEAGNLESAQDAILHLLKLEPRFRISHARAAFPMRQVESHQRIEAAFRAAGLPE